MNPHVSDPDVELRRERREAPVVRAVEERRGGSDEGGPASTRLPPEMAGAPRISRTRQAVLEMVSDLARTRWVACTSLEGRERAEEPGHLSSRLSSVATPGARARGRLDVSRCDS